MDRLTLFTCSSKIHRLLRTGTLFFAFTCLVAYFPSSPSAEDLILDSLIEDEFDLEDILSDIPSNLNPEIASELDLRALPLFGNREIGAFLAFRDSIQSAYSIVSRLEEIPELGSMQSLVLRTAVQNNIPASSLLNGAVRTGISAAPDDLSAESRYYSSLHIEKNDRFRFGLRVERDPGEPAAVDAFSGYLTLRAPGWGYLVIGDYRPGFGQGLVWSRQTRTFTSGASMLRRESLRVENTSWEECGYLRGLFASASRGMLGMQAWASSRDLDATLNDSGQAETIRTTGLHLSGENRGNLRERIAGANLSVRTEAISFGVTADVSGYTPALARKPGEKYLDAPSAATFRHLSTSGIVEETPLSLFYEAAIMNGGEHAFLAGMQVHPRGSRAGIVFRDYSRGYWAPRAAAISSFGSVSDEQGMYASIETSTFRTIRMSASLDLARSRGRTWQYPMPSSRRRMTLSLERKMTHSVKAVLTCRSSRDSENDSGRWSLTGRITARPARNPGSVWRVLTALASGEGRRGAYGEIGRGWGRENRRVEASVGLFQIPDYAARYYRYEDNVPGRGFSTAVWGRGASMVVVGRLGILSLRYRTADSDLMRPQREIAIQGDWSL